MNAIPIRLVRNEAGARAAAAVHADAHIGAAMDALSEAIGDVVGQRRALTDAEANTVMRMRVALVALSHARCLNEPNMMERRT